MVESGCEDVSQSGWFSLLGPDHASFWPARRYVKAGRVPPALATDLTGPEIKALLSGKTAYVETTAAGGDCVWAMAVTSDMATSTPDLPVMRAS